MSDSKSKGASHAGSGPADEDSDFESWLRVAAHVPDDFRRVPLPRAGQVVGGKYRIDAELGKGGMGAVYRATHTVSGKAVALKWMLRPASDERAKQRFTREARAAGRVDHPNVVDVYDLGEEGEAGYLVMELLHGESLRARLSHGPLSPVAAVDLLLPALRGVAAVHRMGVVHRDLKPDNIFLCRGPEGEEREAKVLDFGISAISTLEQDSQTTLTKDGTVLGTPMYMSPEQLESSKDVDARTDVYAFGVILYQALTGALPFAGESYSALVLAIANTHPKPLRELRPDIPEGLERAVLHAMDKDKDRRLPSVDALIAALSPYASVKSAGSGEHLSRELAALPRSRATSAAGRVAWAAVVLGLVAALGWWVTRAKQPISVPEAAARVPPTPATPAAQLPKTAAASVPPEDTREPAAAVAAPPSQPGASRSLPQAPELPRARRPRPPQSEAPAPAPPSGSAPRAGRIVVDEM